MSVDRGEVQDRVNLEHIKRATAKHFGISRAALIGSTRVRSVTLPRQVAMYCARTMTRESTVYIGQSFGGRDHATVLHACSKIERCISEDPRVAEMVIRVKSIALGMAGADD